MGHSTTFLPLPCDRADPQTDPMSIWEWPIAERPREKPIARGAQALSEAELLALLIGSARFAAMQAALERARCHYCEPLRIGSALAGLLVMTNDAGLQLRPLFKRPATAR